jgi:hypothetical protein
VVAAACNMCSVCSVYAESNVYAERATCNVRRTRYAGIAYWGKFKCRSEFKNMQVYRACVESNVYAARATCGVHVMQVLPIGASLSIKMCGV